jgi:hypothetical protein
VNIVDDSVFEGQQTDDFLPVVSALKIYEVVSQAHQHLGVPGIAVLEQLLPEEVEHGRKSAKIVVLADMECEGVLAHRKILPCST